ncbi:MAG: prolipoprotein diacylglyceryl transferase [Firmicutes bacterium]|nr:prolipoprotein diacylglyceryl transferase [Bacillota bacterium]
MSSFLPVPNPVAFSVGGFDIMWYGIMVVLGMLTALCVGYFSAERYGISKDRTLDVFIILIIAGVICARLYYVIFEWDMYKDNLLSIFDIRRGGLAIHGGIIGGVGALIVACKKFWKEDFWRLLDIIAPGLALAQAIGRWGNYFNSEAHGGKTDLPWAIECDGELVHPTFLYESIWCLLLGLFLLWFMRNAKKHTFDGQVFLLYAILYSVERIAVEQLRTDSLMIGPFKQAQIFSFIMILAAIIFWYFRKDKGVAYKKEQAAKAAAAAAEPETAAETEEPAAEPAEAAEPEAKEENE